MAGSVVVMMILSLFIICCLVLRQRKKLDKTDQEWFDMISPKDSRNLFGRLSVVFKGHQIYCVVLLHAVMPSTELQSNSKSGVNHASSNYI